MHPAESDSNRASKISNAGLIVAVVSFVTGAADYFLPGNQVVFDSVHAVSGLVGIALIGDSIYHTIFPSTKVDSEKLLRNSIKAFATALILLAFTKLF